MMLTSLVVLFCAALTVNGVSVSKRLKSVKSEDIIIVQQIVQNLVYNIDVQSRSGGVCTDEFQEFVEDNVDPNVVFIGTGDIPFDRSGTEEFYGFFCDIGIVTFRDEDHFDASFAVLSYTKESKQEFINAVSRTLIYSLLIPANDARATFILRNQWEFKKEKKGNKDWLINQWLVDVEQVNITNLT